MNSRILTALVLGLLGCANYSHPVGPVPEPALLWYEQAAASAFVSPTCDGLPSIPQTHQIDVMGIAVVQPCGLVATALSYSAYKNRFDAESCQGIAPLACEQKYSEMFSARLSLRYPSADWERVEILCRAYPMECGNQVSLEEWVLESHNTGVDAWHSEQAKAHAKVQRQQDQRALEAAQEAEAYEDERRRRVGLAILRGFQAATTPKPTVQCRSTTLGTTTTTSCQ